MTFNVYRKVQGDTNPPVLIASGLTSKSYTDATVAPGEIYEYSVGAVKNGIEKLSGSITVDARLRRVKLKIYSGNLSDLGTSGKTWVNNGVTFANNVLNFSGSSYLETSGIDFTNDFEVSTIINIPSAASKAVFSILTNVSQYSEWTGNCFAFSVGGLSSASNGKLFFDSANTALFMRSTTVLLRNVDYKVGFRKIGTKLQLLINDVVEQEVQYQTLSYNNYLSVGGFKPDSNQRFVGTIRNFEII